MIRSFFSLCREEVLARSLPFNVPHERSDRDRFWTQIAPELFNQALSRKPFDELYDAVFVDEAQDFHANWWIPVQLLLKDPDRGRLYLFCDPDQAGVYGNGGSYPDSGMVEYNLQENCRNTRHIVGYCGAIIARSIECFEDSPLGAPPAILQAIADTSHRAQVVRKLVGSFVTDGFRPSRIAILSPWAPDSVHSSLKYITHVGGVPIATDETAFDSWIADSAFWGGTIKSFKGLEADCVIVTDISVPDSNSITTADLFVAASRAKHRLALLPSTPTAAEYLTKWASQVLASQPTHVD